VSPEVDKYLAHFVAREPQSQQAGARKRLPVRVSDARCPPTMPFPADPGKDSRFIGRAGLELVHAMDGNRPFVNVTAAEPTRVGRQSGNPMPAERFEKPAVESLPAAFCENFEQCGISAIIAARRENPAAYRRACVALLMLLADARTNRVRNKFWRVPRAISVGHQQVRRPQALATRISYYYAGWMEKGGRPVRFSARPYNVTRLSHSISRGRRPVVLYPVRNAAFFYCVPALLCGGIFGAGSDAVTRPAIFGATIAWAGFGSGVIPRHPAA
jgi:hypothetical protein